MDFYFLLIFYIILIYYNLIKQIYTMSENTDTKIIFQRWMKENHLQWLSIGGNKRHTTTLLIQLSGSTQEFLSNMENICLPCIVKISEEEDVMCVMTIAKDSLSSRSSYVIEFLKHDFFYVGSTTTPISILFLMMRVFLVRSSHPKVITRF